MSRPLLILLAGLALAVRAAAAPAGHGLPPTEDDAAARLNSSPRHGEFHTVDVRGTPVRVWVVYPERKDKAPVVLVIHEIFGLTDWIRAVTDQLAAEGFLAVAPDLLSGKGPHGGGSDDFPARDDATKAVSGLDRDEVLARLDAVRDWALAQPSAGTSSGTVGFCWGGGTSFACAVHQPQLDAAVVYYGTPPQDLSTLAAVRAPVLGLYGGDDARVTSTVATVIRRSSRGSIISRAARDFAARSRMVKVSRTRIGNPKTATTGFAWRTTGSTFLTTPWSPNQIGRGARWFGRCGLTIRSRSGALCRAA